MKRFDPPFSQYSSQSKLPFHKLSSSDYLGLAVFHLNWDRERTMVQCNPNSNEILPNPNNRRNKSEKCLTNGDGHEVSAQTKQVKEGSNNLVQKKKVKSKIEKSTDNDAQRVFLGG